MACLCTHKEEQHHSFAGQCLQPKQSWPGYKKPQQHAENGLYSSHSLLQASMQHNLMKL